MVRSSQITYLMAIDAVITRPWPGKNSPPLPPVSLELRQAVKEELREPGVRKAYEMLDAKRRNVEWFEGIEILEKEGAVWALVSCLSHPSADVQIHSLRGLGRIGGSNTIPSLLTYAESMAVSIGGSENATIHGIIHETIAKTMSSITGIRITISGQDPLELRKGIDMWRAWYETYK